MESNICPSEVYRGCRLYPPGHRKGSRTWVVRTSIDGRTIERALGSTDLGAAQTAVDALLESNCFILPDRPDSADGLPGWTRRLMTTAKERAAIRGIPFTLTEDDMTAMARRAAGRCEMSGVPFSSLKPRGCSRRPLAASLDRIRPARGYTFENCRLVAFALNVAMSDWGEDVMVTLALGLLNRARERNPHLARLSDELGLKIDAEKAWV